GAALGAAAAFAAGALLAVTPPAVRADPALGLPALLWMFAVVWATDIGAYFAGKTFGGPKLWPAVSPGKTWSGFFGGALCGCLAGVLVLAVWAGWSGAGWIALASLVASVAGQGGDLAESALKRRAGVKDSARIIPGHGGVLDRLDAFWAVCLLAALARAALHLQRAG
ncbi:phosphatidate cytidylyltransferase, partial [Camelimonas abortus]